MVTVTTLQNRTYKILEAFTNKIGEIKLEDNDYSEMALLGCTKEFFNEMNKLNMEEFGKIFEYNFFSATDAEKREKYQKCLNFLVALLINEYSESDLLRYFFPANLSHAEKRPEYVNSRYSSFLSRVSYWFQFLGYCLRQLSNKPKYEPSSTDANASYLVGVIKDIKKLLKEREDYLLQYTTNEGFKNKLEICVAQVEKKSILPKKWSQSKEEQATQQDEQQNFNMQVMALLLAHGKIIRRLELLGLDLDQLPQEVSRDHYNQTILLEPSSEARANKLREEEGHGGGTLHLSESSSTLFTSSNKGLNKKGCERRQNNRPAQRKEEQEAIIEVISKAINVKFRS